MALPSLFDDILSTFDPAIQSKYCSGQNLQRCFTGKAPRLREIAQTYGHGSAVRLIEAQVINLSEFCGSKGKLTPQQLAEIAELILDAYGNFKITELMAFCWSYKLGEYGEFYGNVDGLKIMRSLLLFAEQRRKLHAANQAEAEKLQRAQQREEDFKNCITYEEFLAQKGQNSK